ncbi:hypothetical protein N473_04655 [Pseudoalteromonas luteoviolacea CPMOR-1]|uniref:Uncharacterized protein n=2 Tax=Pseudoalteromonas luteoviolacea TaxID=43657 RepID=A0A167I004_9GAMM|nr:hypothetical protein N473_04655 [Pseudoalteromonas luteoviolacea CPMOR-1]
MIEEVLGERKPRTFSVEEHLKLVGLKDLNTNEISRANLIELLTRLTEDGVVLNRAKIRDILIAFEFPPELSNEENAVFLHNFTQQTSSRKLRSVVEAKKNIDTENMEKELNELRSKLEQISETDIPSINELKKSVTKIAQESKSFTAAIKLPAPKDMEVQLVSADSLHRLSEHNSDINVFLTFTAVFLGAFLGMLGNIAFNTSTTGQTYGVMAILAVVSIIFFVLYWRMEGRKKSLTDTLLNDEEAVYLEDYTN